MAIVAPVQCPALGTHLYTVAPNGTRTEPKLVKFSGLLAALALAILYPVDQADGLWHFGLLDTFTARPETLELVVNRLGFAAALFTNRNFDALIPLLMGCGSVPIISNGIERFSVTDALEVFSELDKRYLTWAIPKLTNGDLTLRSLPRPLLTFTTDKDPRNGVPVEQVGGSKFKFGVLLFHRQSGKTVVQFVHDMLQESDYFLAHDKETVFYRLPGRATATAAGAEAHDLTAKYSREQFMSIIEDDPYFTQRHRLNWAILRKDSSASVINLCSLAADAVFSKICLEPARGEHDLQASDANVPPGSLVYSAPWATTAGTVVMPAASVAGSTLHQDIEPAMLPYLRFVLRPIRGEAYSAFGAQFKYRVEVYLRTAAANRDLANAETASRTQRTLRKLFRIYPVSVQRSVGAWSYTVPQLGKPFSNRSFGVPLLPLHLAAAASDVARPEHGLRDWIHRLESSVYARTLTFVDRSRSEPYFRLGTHGFVYNYLTGEFARTCPAAWLVPAVVQPFKTMELRAAFIDSNLSSVYCELVAIPPSHGGAATRSDMLYSTATLIIASSTDAVTLIERTLTDVGYEQPEFEVDARAAEVPAITLWFGVVFGPELTGFFHVVQRAIETQDALGPAVLRVAAPLLHAPADHDVKLDYIKTVYGPKVLAIAEQVLDATGRVAIFCQSPALASLLTTVINQVLRINAIDASSPNARLRHAAISIFHRNPGVCVIVLSLNGNDGSAYAAAAPPFAQQLGCVENVIFAHPLVAESDAASLAMVKRALDCVSGTPAAVTWFVAKDTIEEEIMRPIAGKYARAAFDPPPPEL
ncbi:hypothetical protein H9P43_000162 [Blastocladiella emersonii ATCC 22665]|nr:hypothetical protein H9P43_000162 [Blastocladiella emersonii ATCC 22665]